MPDAKDAPENGRASQPAKQFEVLGDGGLLARAPAKINLVLMVGPAGADGYHGVDSVVAKISLYDTLTVRPRTDGELTLKADGLDAGPVEDNLVLRAARALQKHAATEAGADIELDKSIPPGAGLGGGSSDAATTLGALMRLWRLDVPDEDVASLAVSLGADVPLFLGPPASRISGRGEKVVPLDVRPFAALVVMPPIHSRTADVYRAYDRLNPHAMVPFDDSPFCELAPPLWRKLHNDLFRPACELYPEIFDWMHRVQNQTGRPVHMSGSGSALFVLTEQVHEALELADRLGGEMGRHVRVASLNPW